MQSWNKLGSASLTDPSWSSAYLRQKNTFIELVPPLSESVLGFETLRRQTSAPTSPIAGSTAREEDSTDPHDQLTACDNVAAEKPALASGSPCSGEGDTSALPVSDANPSWKNWPLDENLAGCDGGRLQLLDEKLASSRVRRRQTSKASGITEATADFSSPDGGARQSWSQSAASPVSPDSRGQEGRSLSKLSGIAGPTNDVGGTRPENPEALQDRWELMYPTGSPFARLLKAKGLAAAVASVPHNEDDEPTSLGSFGHAVGTCRPCAHWSSTKGCAAGVLCRFCHFDHQGLRKPSARPCKGKRERYRKLLGKLAAQVDEDPTSFGVNEDRLPPSIKFDPRMKAKLSVKMSRHAQEVRRQQEAVAHVVAMPR